MGLLGGDVISQSMFLLHGPQASRSNRFRISCDTRHQRKDQPADDRWPREAPRGHDRFSQAAEQLEPVEVSRQHWVM